MGFFKGQLVSSQRSGRGGGRGLIVIKSLFFDSKKVLDSVDTATRKVMSKFGAFVRRDARKSIRRPRRKTKSQMKERELEIFARAEEQFRRGERPVKPRLPLAPSKPGEPPRSIVGTLKRLIFFAYDARQKGVVIGPIPTGQKTGAPRVLEEGGTIKAPGSGFDGKRVKPRPYMVPALNKNLVKIDAIWRNSVR